MADLRQISGAIHSGRLYPPFTAMGVQRYCSAKDGESVSSEMQQLTDEGLELKHLALILETLAEDRGSQAQLSDSDELVLTGPEVPGAACRDTSVVVRELFSSALDYVLVAGYAVYQGRQVFRALADRMQERPGLKVLMFLDIQRSFSDTTRDSEIVRRFAHRFKNLQWPSVQMPEVFYDPRGLERDTKKKSSLHAKCIVVDGKTAFVSSANFTEAAQVRNIEVGVLIRSVNIATQLTQHFEALASAGLLKPVPGI